MSMLKNLGKYADDILFLAGSACFCTGFFFWNIVAGMIVTGVMMILTAVLVGAEENKSA